MTDDIRLAFTLKTCFLFRKALEAEFLLITNCHWEGEEEKISVGEQEKWEKNWFWHQPKKVFLLIVGKFSFIKKNKKTRRGKNELFDHKWRTLNFIKRSLEFTKALFDHFWNVRGSLHNEVFIPRPCKQNLHFKMHLWKFSLSLFDLLKMSVKNRNFHLEIDCTHNTLHTYMILK